MTVQEKNNEVKVYCSVCPDWEITDLETAPILIDNGKKHYFCNEDCLEQFNGAKK